MIRAALNQARQRGELRRLDLHIGRFLEQLHGQECPELLLAGTLGAAAVAAGHVCLPLAEPTARLPVQLSPKLLPPADKWRELLLASPVVGKPGAETPLILDGKNRLYLARYHHYEEELTDRLRRLAGQTLELDGARARPLLERLFPPGANREQKTAAALALLKPLLIVSGGPGTGKTHTVARILALVLALAGDHPPRVALAAPTGKAAARLEESIRKAGQSLPADAAAALPGEAQTLHRLLGYHLGEGRFHYRSDNPLPLDLLVLDEASMIDVELMTTLFQALPEQCRLILLGDHNQLASVEAGSLFSDLCADKTPSWSPALRAKLEMLGIASLPGEDEKKSAPLLADCVIQLRTSYRFRDDSGISALAAAVNSGVPTRLEPCLGGSFADLEVNFSSGEERRQWLQDWIRRGFGPIAAAASPEEGLSALEDFRLLCALREGPDGVEGVNHLAEQTLGEAGLIPRERPWYRGKPIIIRRNHYELQLFNGDTGLLWADRDGRLMAWFRRTDGQLVPVSPARLPAHDAAYAMTIHQAQGSEFERVLLLLPEKGGRILSRELLYTGITRARSQLSLCCAPHTLNTAIITRTRRYSGLRDRLWQTEP